MTQDDVGQLQISTAMEGIEKEDPPENVEQYECKTRDSRGDEEVFGITFHANGPRSRHVS